MDGPFGSAKLGNRPCVPPGDLMAHLQVLLCCEGTEGRCWPSQAVLGLDQGLRLTPE